MAIAGGTPAPTASLGGPPALTPSLGGTPVRAVTGGTPVPMPRPAGVEHRADDGWQAIDFISDLHLCAEMPRTFAAWSAHLQHTPADAVFMLGDLFELWVGDDMRKRPFEQQCVDVMAAAGGRKHLAFMAGNRDFLLGDDMLRASGMTGLPDPTVLLAWGRRVLLSHGDGLCLGDTGYQAFRQQVRSPAWQAVFLAKPLSERLAIAAQVRSASEAKRQFDGDGASDIDPAEALRWMQALDTPALVHGHTHRPGSDALAPGLWRHVLSDWDLDDATRPRAEVLRLTRDGFHRVPPATPD